MTESRRLSGRHITIMVVAVSAAAVLAPVGVAAASKPPAVTLADGDHASHLASVSKSGAVDVNVSGTTNVTATPTAPSHPIALNAHATVNGLSMTVPAAGHLVVQSLSAELGVVTPITIAGLHLKYVENGVNLTLNVPLPHVSPVDGNSASLFMATVPATIYPDPGSKITLNGEYDAAVSPSLFDVTLTGYVA